MGDIYVKVEDFSSDDFKEMPKLKKSAPDAMNKSAEAAVKDTKGFTGKEPTGDGAKGYTVSGNLTKFSKKTEGKSDVLKCTVEMVLNEWPKRVMKTATLKGMATIKVDTTTNEKHQLADAVDCAAAAAVAGTETALAHIKSLQ